MIRILVVEDFEIVRRGIVSLLRLQPDWQIAGEAADGLDAVSKAKELQCDVVVLDISLPGLNGLVVAPMIRNYSPETEIIFVSQHVSRGMIEEAFKSGARGYVSKSDAGRELVLGIRAVSQHRHFLSSSCVNMLPSVPSAPPAAHT
jgi:DNA-binding NarL/FixJ family response regulator